MRERHGLGDRLNKSRQFRYREKYPAEVEHRRQKPREVEIEMIDISGHRRDTHRQPAEYDAREEPDPDTQQGGEIPEREVDDVENEQD